MLPADEVGDRRSELSRLFNDHYDAVYRFCRARTGSADMADEVASDAFVEAARLFADGRQSEVTIGWLISVARNRMIDRWRANERQRKRLERLLQFRSERNDTSSTTQDEAVMQALASLPERQRSVIVLRYLDGYSVSEVADALGCSYQATESLLARGRRSFAHAYKGAS